MSACFDRLRDVVENNENKRNTVAAIGSGLLFFIGWWVFIGVLVTKSENFNGWYVIAGLVGTVSMFMINVVSNTQVRGDSMTDGALGTKGARLWLLMGFVLGFGALIASIWIMFQVYVIPTEGEEEQRHIGPGIALFVQNFLIFVASLIYKFGRSEESAW